MRLGGLTFHDEGEVLRVTRPPASKLARRALIIGVSALFLLFAVRAFGLMFAALVVALTGEVLALIGSGEERARRRSFRIARELRVERRPGGYRESARPTLYLDGTPVAAEHALAIVVITPPRQKAAARHTLFLVPDDLQVIEVCENGALDDVQAVAAALTTALRGAPHVATHRHHAESPSSWVGTIALLALLATAAPVVVAPLGWRIALVAANLGVLAASVPLYALAEARHQGRLVRELVDLARRARDPGARPGVK